MILNTGEHWEPEDTDIIQWQKTYQAVDVYQELAKMESWLDANPTRRKTKSGIKRFINLWLTKAQDKGGSPAISQKKGGSLRDRSNLDDITDITWLEGAIKEQMRKVFTEKYGQAYDG